MRDRYGLRFVAVLGWVLVACACTPVRGKSRSASQRGDADASSAVDAGSGKAGDDGKAEADAAVTESNAGAAGASAGKGGSVSAGRAGSAGVAGMPAAGSSAMAAGSGAAAAGSGGGGTPALPSDDRVHGVLIDALRRPLANVALRVGERSATTDELGRFEADGVGASYDVSFKLSTLVDQMPATYAWRFEGLTRRDPTLQTYVASEMQQTNLVWHTHGATFPLADDQRMQAGFASPDGDFEVGVNAADYASPLVFWYGPTRTAGTTHGLLYRVSGAQELPLEYPAHDAKPLSLAVGADAEATFEFSGSPLPSGPVSGQVSAKGQGSRENWIVVRWADGAAFLIADDESSADAFSYVVPAIADASVAIVAMQGRYDSFPRAVAFADGVTARQADLHIEVPAASSLSAPGDGVRGIDGTAQFAWTGDAHVFVFVALAADGYDRMYVVTAAKQAKLPIGEATSYAPPAGATFRWHIETHGDYASVDDAASSEGLISAFFDGSLHGPRRGNGSLTASEQRSFITQQ